MSLLLPTRPLLSKLWFTCGIILPHPSTFSNPISGFPSRRSQKNAVPRRIRGNSGLRSSSPEDPPETASDKVEFEVEEILSFQPWNVPWDWKLLKRWDCLDAVKSTGSGYPTMEGGEEAAIMFFGDQLLKAIAKLSVLYFFVSQHQPLPDDVFSFRLNQPFDLQRGWLLWAIGGLSVASVTAFLSKAILTGSLSSLAQSETESVAWLIPFIGSPNISMFSLMGVLGVLAPVSEEILYRGFLLTSLTKWLSPSISIILSSAVFTLAHLSPGKSLEIFIFGTVLGMVYGQTRNLLTPICMHALWNLAVILALTFLHVSS